MNAPTLTSANRNLPVRANNNTERMLEGAEFIFGQYREAQNILAQAKEDLIIDTVTDALDDARRAGNTNIPTCTEWLWVSATKSKGTRGIELIMKKEGLVVVPPPVSPPTTVVSKDEEPNDRIEDVSGVNTRGNFMKNNEPVEGVISQAGDQDTFQIEVLAGSTFTIDLSPASGQDYDLYLFSSGARRLERSWNGGDDAEQIVHTATGSNTVFYVRVEGYDGASSATPYTLNVVFTPPRVN